MLQSLLQHLLRLNPDVRTQLAGAVGMLPAEALKSMILMQIKLRVVDPVQRMPADEIKATILKALESCDA